MGKGIGCVSRGLRFNTQHPCGGSQCVTTVSGDLTHSSCFCGHKACLWCIDIHAGKNSHTHEREK